MALTNKEVKQRYFDKKYKEAKLIECGCGCKIQIKEYDKYGRKHKFVSGHNGRKYEDSTQFKREWNHRNRKARYEYKKLYFRKRKVELIFYKGGKCEGVGCMEKYDGENACIFHFHHRDPKIKLFNVGNNTINFSREKIKKEVDKCDLLCANCHEKKHSAKF